MKNVIFLALLATAFTASAHAEVATTLCDKSLNAAIRAYGPLKAVKAELIAFTKLNSLNSSKADFEFTMFTPGENGWKAKGIAHTTLLPNGDCKLESAEGQIAQ